MGVNSNTIQFSSKNNPSEIYTYYSVLRSLCFSTEWRQKTVFQIEDTSQILYLNQILLSEPHNGYESQNIVVPNTVFSITISYNGGETYSGMYLNNTTLDVSNCVHLIHISNIDSTSTGTILLNSGQMSKFQDRITEVDNVKLFDGVLTIQETS